MPGGAPLRDSRRPAQVDQVGHRDVGCATTADAAVANEQIKLRHAVLLRNAVARVRSCDAMRWPYRAVGALEAGKVVRPGATRRWWAWRQRPTPQTSMPPVCYDDPADESGKHTCDAHARRGRRPTARSTHPDNATTLARTRFSADFICGKWCFKHLAAVYSTCGRSGHLPRPVPRPLQRRGLSNSLGARGVVAIASLPVAIVFLARGVVAIAFLDEFPCVRQMSANRDATTTPRVRRPGGARMFSSDRARASSSILSARAALGSIRCSMFTAG